MARRKRTRTDWYQYHRAQSEQRAESAARQPFVSERAPLEQQIHGLRQSLTAKSREEGLASKIAGFFGLKSAFRREEIEPIEERLRAIGRQLGDLRDRELSARKAARRRGREQYVAEHAIRRQEAEARKVRVAERREERRIRYLENSPSIRTAAKGLKRRLIEEASVDGRVQCYYCGRHFEIAEVHIEHKLPVAKGGTNRRSNLALACGGCNLRKGRKTEEQFRKELDRDEGLGG